MLISIICLDKPDHVELRMKTRPEHLKWIEASAPPALFIGPLKSEDGAIMRGSLYIAEFADVATARAFHESDPYTKAGLFERVVIAPTFNVAKPT